MATLTAKEQVYWDLIEPDVQASVLTTESVDQTTYDGWTDQQKQDAVLKQWAPKNLSPHPSNDTTITLASDTE